MAWAGILLVDPAGRVLLARRSAKVSNPGLWAIPGGGVEDGETEFEAAVREYEEEMGIDIAAPPINAWFFDDDEIVYRDKWVFVIPVKAHPRVTLNWENSDYEWADPKNLPEPLHRGTRKILRAWLD